MWAIDILCDVAGICAYESPGYNFDSYRDIIVRKNSTLIQLHIPFNFAVMGFSWSRFIQLFIAASQSYWQYQHIFLWAVEIFNPFSCTYVQFDIVVMTWHDFTSYSIVFTYVNFHSDFQPCCTCLGVDYFRYGLKTQTEIIYT